MAATVTQFVALIQGMLGGTIVNNLKTAPSLGVPREVQQSWAQYSPWFAAGVYQPPPMECEVVQVNLLQRHGARYPEKGEAKAMKKTLGKLKRVKKIKDPSLEFINDYEYDLGIDDLIPFGAAQSFDAGQEHFVRYATLLDEDMLPFVRVSESGRVVDSARNWTAGFAHASGQRYVPRLSVIIPQLTNDTLDDKMCPQATTQPSSHATKKWVDVFAPPIADRLNAALPGAKFKKTDVANLMMLCPFETVVHEAPSPWCKLFTMDDWGSYEYYGDLSAYYGNGYGQRLGRVQGVGYVNELLARLTSQPVQDATQTNRTLDDNPLTFPLNRTLYADFSHDHQIVSIYSALGLFRGQSGSGELELDPEWMEEGRVWVNSRMVPFSARMVVEKVACGARAKRRLEEGEGERGNLKSTKGKLGEVRGNVKLKPEGEYVRVLVNDAVQPLTFCGAREDGMCALASFVQSQHYARNNGEGDWALCFVTADS